MDIKFLNYISCSLIISTAKQRAKLARERKKERVVEILDYEVI